MILDEVIKNVDLSNKLLESAYSNLISWLEGGFLPQWALESITELIEKGEWEELNNRFYKKLEFGTGGMRGRTVGAVPSSAEVALGEPVYAAVGSNCLNDFNIIQAVIGLYRYTKSFLIEAQREKEIPKIVIAHDVRYFSKHFCDLASSVWLRLGGDANIFEGPRSTPELSFFVRQLKAHVGVVITASHNPSHDNGFKVYFQDGGQVVDPHASAIIKEVNRVELALLKDHYAVDVQGVNTVSHEEELFYQNTLEELVIEPQLIKKQKPKIVFSPIHGTGSVISVPLMKRLGVDVLTVEEQMTMDSSFPTVKSPNPENAEALSYGIALANKENAELVIATDPDADRMGIAVRCNNGKMELLSGNMIGSILAEYRISRLKEKGWIPESGTMSACLIKTFVTTPLQEVIAAKHGIKCVNTLTGFKWIGQKLDCYEQELKQNYFKEEGEVLDYDNCSYRKRAELLQKYSTYYIFGGEESYGYLAGDRVRDKDANAAVVMICEIAAYLKENGLTFIDYLDAIYKKYGLHKERLVTLQFEGAVGSRKIASILDLYRNDSPTDVNGHKVVSIKDFGKEDIFDIDGQRIPKQDFYFLELDNGYKYAVRGSGTEPKIKFYLFGYAPVLQSDNVEDKKDLVDKNLLALEAAIRKMYEKI